MKKKEKSRRMFVGTISVVLTAIVLAGAIKEEVTFVGSVYMVGEWEYAGISNFMKIPTDY